MQVVVQERLRGPAGAVHAGAGAVPLLTDPAQAQALVAEVVREHLQAVRACVGVCA